MQLPIFDLTDQPDLMIKYNLITKTLLTNQFQVLGIYFPTTTSDGGSCFLRLTKAGILSVTFYCKNKSCTLTPLANKTD